MDKWEYGAGTHVGWVRELNEDRYAADSGAGVWLVADGMGGCEAGEVASAAVAETTLTSIKRGSSLARAVTDAHRAVVELLDRGQGAVGMGSTVVVLRLRGRRYEVAWVGDSRAYLWGRGKLRQLTRDDTIVQTLVDGGVIDAGEARDHPERSKLTQALGPVDAATLKVGTINGKLRPGEQILLCSDGLSSELRDEQIAAVLKKSLDPQQKVDRLIQAALAAGGKDNVTALLVGIPAETAKPEPTAEVTLDLKVITQPVPLACEEESPSDRGFGMASWLVPLALIGLALFGWWWQQKND
ncbi:MAG TPA: protein phosphatase 2C domain-containing protein [Candidatus Competibacter sp.]|nr:protein phosphatase 2C domain-containing protein [Candidatus Competibacter sp.]